MAILCMYDRIFKNCEQFFIYLEKTFFCASLSVGFYDYFSLFFLDKRYYQVYIRISTLGILSSIITYVRTVVPKHIYSWGCP